MTQDSLLKKFFFLREFDDDYNNHEFVTTFYFTNKRLMYYSTKIGIGYFIKNIESSSICAYSECLDNYFLNICIYDSSKLYDKYGSCDLKKILNNDKIYAFRSEI